MDDELKLSFIGWLKYTNTLADENAEFRRRLCEQFDIDKARDEKRFKIEMWCHKIFIILLVIAMIYSIAIIPFHHC
jgi:hypothetical protein